MLENRSVQGQEGRRESLLRQVNSLFNHVHHARRHGGPDDHVPLGRRSQYADRSRIG